MCRLTLSVAEGRAGGSGVRRAPSVRHSGTGQFCSQPFPPLYFGTLFGKVNLDPFCQEGQFLKHYIHSLDTILFIGGAAGAVDEESFISSFEDCKKV